MQGPREAVVWMAVHHKQKKALEFFSREVAPAGTGMGELKPQLHLILLCFQTTMVKFKAEEHLNNLGQYLISFSLPSIAPGLTAIVGGRPRM